MYRGLTINAYGRSGDLERRFPADGVDRNSAITEAQQLLDRDPTVLVVEVTGVYRRGNVEKPVTLYRETQWQ